MDLIQKYYEFAKEVEALLNENSFEPPKDGSYYSIVLVVNDPPKGKSLEPPVGGAVNYIDGKWQVQVQMAEVKRVADGNEQA